MKKMSLYIHIPFCVKKCGYCDFISFDYNKEQMEKYLSYLKKEILHYGRDQKIYTIFIGGGTPSLMSGLQMKDLMEHIREYFDLTECKEISIESNPGTLTEENLIMYKEAGINRISMGVQTLNDETLKTLDRIHDVKQVYESIDLIKKVGFENINLDLMFGLPGQSEDQLESTVKKMIELDPTHISAYSLKFEEGTPFYERLETGDIKALDDELDRGMYHTVISLLREAGYHQYEISNFSKEAYECLHNLVYWEKDDYLGLGIGAHGCIDNERYSNESTLDAYYTSIDEKGNGLKDIQEIDYDDDLFEYIILNLRLNKGLSIDKINKKYKIDFMTLYFDQIEKLKEDELIQVGDRIVLTEKGIDLSNQVFISFLD